MRKLLVVMMAVGSLSAIPAFAEHTKDANAVGHDGMQMQQNMDHTKECDLLLNDCAQQVDSIQQRIERIKTAIKAEGAKPEHAEELRILNRKLKEANETMRALTKPGH